MRHDVRSLNNPDHAAMLKRIRDQLERVTAELDEAEAEPRTREILAKLELADAAQRRVRECEANTSLQTHAHTHARARALARTDTRTHAHTHARTHTRTCARTHTCLASRLPADACCSRDRCRRLLGRSTSYEPP
jgi:hypothetical protein